MTQSPDYEYGITKKEMLDLDNSICSEKGFLILQKVRSRKPIPAKQEKVLDEKLASRYKAILLMCKDTIEDTRRKYEIAPKTCDGCSDYDLCKELRPAPEVGQ